MHVLFLAHAYPRYANDPVGSFILRLAVALREHDVQVTVVAPSAQGLPSRDVFEGIAVERFRYAPRRLETLAYTGTMGAQVADSFAAKLAMLGFLSSEFATGYRVMRHEHVDLIHAHWWFPGGLVGSWLSAVTSKPLVTTLHGSDIRLARGVTGGSRLFRSVSHASTVLTTVSGWLAQEAMTLDEDATPRVAPMPVVSDLFEPGGTHEENRLLFVGKLSEQKGLQHLLRAMSVMRTPATLDVVGAGRVDDAWLRQMAVDLGLADRINWVPLLPQAELAEYYRRAAIHVIPATDEGLGLTAVEALRCGTPVVAFNSGGVTDIVIDDYSGVLVPPGDTQRLAESLDALLANAERREALAAEGRRHVLKRFARETSAARYAEIYREALER